jgi:hypothetical protein
MLISSPYFLRNKYLSVGYIIVVFFAKHIYSVIKEPIVTILDLNKLYI